MKLEVNGNTYTNFLSVVAEIRLDTLSNSFEFSAAIPQGEILPFKEGDKCTVTVGDQLVLTGYIEIIQVSYGPKSHDVTIQGRDKTGDFVDSTIGKIAGLKAPISLKEIIEKFVKHVGVDIKVIDNVLPKKFNAAEDIIVPEIGESVFSFVESMARKRQVLLTSNAEGDIVLSKSEGKAILATLQNVQGFDNNIMRASFSKDSTQRFRKYGVFSSLSPVASNKAGKLSNSSIVDQVGESEDLNIRSGRSLAMLAESPSSHAECKARAQWESRIRKTRGLQYSVTVSGYRPDPELDSLWEVNTTVHVLDDFAGVDSELLINAVTYNLSTSGGKTTTLSLVETNAYTLTLNEPKSQKIDGLF